MVMREISGRFRREEAKETRWREREKRRTLLEKQSIKCGDHGMMGHAALSPLGPHRR